MAYFGFIISVLVLIDSLITKKIGMRGTIISFKEYPKSFILGISVVAIGIIFFFLGIIHIIDL